MKKITTLLFLFFSFSVFCQKKPQLNYVSFQAGLHTDFMKNGSTIAQMNQYGRLKFIIQSKHQLEISARRNFETYHNVIIGESDSDSSMQIVRPANLYNFRYSFGKRIGIALGYEFGNRYLAMGDDTIRNNNYTFTNSKTGEQKFIYNAAQKISIPTLSLGVRFMMFGSSRNFWNTMETDEDNEKSNKPVSFEIIFEYLYAPANTMRVDSLYLLNRYGTDSYFLNNLKFKKGGFRIVNNVSAFGLVFHQEIGMRPGIHYINTEKKIFDGFYVMMGFNVILQKYNRKKYDIENFGEQEWLMNK